MQELPTCAIDDDISPIDRSVRTEASLVAPHTSDAALKFPSIKVFLENDKTLDFSNPAKLLLMVNETGCVEAFILSRSRIPPPRIGRCLQQRIFPEKAS